MSYLGYLRYSDGFEYECNDVERIPSLYQESPVLPHHPASKKFGV